MQLYVFFNPGVRRGWVVNSPRRLFYPLERDPVWTGAENLAAAAAGIRSSDRPARSESLYRLSYCGPQIQCERNRGEPSEPTADLTLYLSIYLYLFLSDPVWCSRCCGQTTGCTVRSSNAECWQGQYIFFSETSRLTLRPTQPPIQWVPGFFLEGKAAGA